MAIDTNHKLTYSYNDRALAPLNHASLIGQYRVPVYVEPPEYIVHVNTDRKRMYTVNTIPPFLMNRILIAKTTTPKYESGGFAYWHDIFMCNYPECADTGWRATNNMYIIIMNASELNSIADAILY
jgi:hypothetical protein